MTVLFLTMIASPVQSSEPNGQTDLAIDYVQAKAEGDDPFCGVLACSVGAAKDDHLPAAGAHATRYGRSVDQQMVASCGCGPWQVVVMEPAQRAGDSRWGG